MYIRIYIHTYIHTFCHLLFIIEYFYFLFYCDVSFFKTTIRILLLIVIYFFYFYFFQGDVSFFETTIRILGGLLSAYEFSCDLYACDQGLLDKVECVLHRMSPLKTCSR